jgi:periplasmic divalent cation tolerance protein
MSETYCVILTTAGSQEEADRLAELLVSSRLATCVQIASITSHYRWEGKVVREPEFLLLIKSAERLYSQVETAILENHSYETPEIIQLPVCQGFARYLSWISENTLE